MNVALELHALTCMRGTRLLFDDLSVVVRAGQMLRVQGANGSGKTSLLRIVCGLLLPVRGEVRWQGRPIAPLRDDFNRQLVYIGHAPALKDDLSAVENLQAGVGLAGLTCSAHDAAVALDRAGLRGHQRLPARLLSQGQRKRVGIARLALHDAAGLWVLDEPFNALDDSACHWLQGLIAEQLGRGGVVVLTSHQARTWDAAQPQVAVTLQATAEPRQMTMATPG